MTAELAPAEALAAVARAQRWEGALRRRTEGLTWMLWGLVTAGIFLSYDAAAPAYEAGNPSVWASLLWVPWLVAGALASWALWRTAALGADLPRRTPGALLASAGWVAAGALGFAVAFRWLPVHDWYGFVVGLGIAWLALAGANVHNSTREGRLAAAGIGAALVVGGLVLGAVTPAIDWSAPQADALLLQIRALRTLLAGGVPFLVGLGLAVRG